MDIINSPDFPEIPDFTSGQYEDLVSALSKGTCIFLGAGASSLAGYKLWDSLKKEMIDLYWNKREENSFYQGKRFDLSVCDSLKEQNDPIEAFDYLYHLDEGMFSEGLKHIFDNDEKRISNKIYQTLGKLNREKTIFVTTNIDMSFQRYLRLKDNNVSIYPNLKSPPKKLSYIHGRIDREQSWVFTTNQYSEAYTSDSIGAPCMDFLIDIFQNYNVFFIGYGLREKEIKQAIARTKRRKQHFWLEPWKRIDGDSLMIRGINFKNNYNIELIPYYVDNNGYETLFDVIDSLHRAISAKIKIRKSSKVRGSA